MFNAERLLAKMVGEVVSKGGSWGVGKTSNLGRLGGGTGLMTIIGLGVGPTRSGNSKYRDLPPAVWDNLRLCRVPTSAVPQPHLRSPQQW